jgi:hypothetical protein
MVFQSYIGGKAQCRGRSCLGATNLSWLQNFYWEQCAYPGAETITKFYSASRVRNDDKRSKEKRSVRADKPLAVLAGLAYTNLSKNRDKQLTFIDRVRCS